MKQDRPSTTALRVALSRAAHQTLDHPKVLDDPVALQIVGAQTPAQAAARNASESGTLPRYLRASVVARSRFAEDELALAVRRGVRQYVVLGAGMDTFAYRNPHRQLRVFEVDHPSSQASKREQLGRAGIPLPEALTFVPVDLESQTLAQALHLAGFKADAPAFFSWLGVTMYLEPSTVMATLQSIAGAPTGSQVVFDYVIPVEHHPLLRRIVYRLMLARLAALGEPWKSFFDPGSLHRELTALGFPHLEDLGQNAINARYFAGRADGLQVGPGIHFVSART